MVDFLPGDILGFSASGCLGATINLGTWGVPGWGLSHVALVGRNPDSPSDNVLWEATGLVGTPCVLQGRYTSGVQVQHIAARVAGYVGRVWHYPLVKPLKPEQVDDLDTFCEQHLGRDYDAIGAFRSRGLSLVERCVFRPADLTSVFCSEFVAAAHAFAGVIVGLNISRMNPNRLVRYERAAWILAKPSRLK